MENVNIDKDLVLDLNSGLPIHKEYCDINTFNELLSLGGYMTDERAKRLHFVRVPPVGFVVDDVTKMMGCAVVASLNDIKTFLREDKGICVEVDACAGGYIWELCKAYDTNTFSGGTTIYVDFDVNDPKCNDCGKYDRYEVALNEGIKAAIKYLKKRK